MDGTQEGSSRRSWEIHAGINVAIGVCACDTGSIVDRERERTLTLCLPSSLVVTAGSATDRQDGGILESCCSEIAFLQQRPRPKTQTEGRKKTGQQARQTDPRGRSGAGMHRFFSYRRLVLRAVGSHLEV